VWPAAALAGALLAVIGIGRFLFKRRRSSNVDLGALSDSWLAEQRRQRTDRFQ
jgi:hypothetical protein